MFHHVVLGYKICSTMLPLDTVMVRNLIRNKTFYFAFNENNSVTSLELGYIVGQLPPPKSHMVFLNSYIIAPSSLFLKEVKHTQSPRLEINVFYLNKTNHVCSYKFIQDYKQCTVFSTMLVYIEKRCLKKQILKQISVSFESITPIMQ